MYFVNENLKRFCWCFVMVVGHGNFGSIHLCTRLEDSKTFVIKKLNQYVLTEDARESLSKEVYAFFCVDSLCL